MYKAAFFLWILRIHTKLPGLDQLDQADSKIVGDAA